MICGAGVDGGTAARADSSVSLVHVPASVSIPAGNSTGSFTSTGQRFAYNTTTGQLVYDAQGSTPGSTQSLITTLFTTGSAHPVLSASDLQFIH